MTTEPYDARPATSQWSENFIKVELEGRGHSTVTEHRSQEAVDAVLDFFRERLSLT